MDNICSKSPDGIHGIGGGARGSEVRCGACGQLDEIETARAKAWWNGKHEKDCLCSKCDRNIIGYNKDGTPFYPARQAPEKIRPKQFQPKVKDETK